MLIFLSCKNNVLILSYSTAIESITLYYCSLCRYRKPLYTLHIPEEISLSSWLKKRSHCQADLVLPLRRYMAWMPANPPPFVTALHFYLSFCSSWGHGVLSRIIHSRENILDKEEYYSDRRCTCLINITHVVDWCINTRTKSFDGGYRALNIIT